MPIDNEALNKSTNSQIKVNDSNTMRNVFAAYKAADGRPWWRLIVQRQNGTWAAITFRELDPLAASLGAAFFNTPIRDLPIPFTEVIAVEQDHYTTYAAEQLAYDSPSQLLVVTKNGQFVGILSVGARRSPTGKSAGPTAAEMFDRQLSAPPPADVSPDTDEVLPLAPAPPPIVEPQAPPAAADDLSDALRGGGPQESEPAPRSAPEVQSAEPAESADVFFRAYYSHEVQVAVRHSLYVYAHIQAALAAIEKDIQKFKEELGGNVPAPKIAKQSARLQPGTPITIIPECDELEFDPPSLTKKWDDQWVRFDFDFKPPASTAGDTLTVRVSVMVNGIEIANIKFAMEAVEAASPPRSPMAANPTNTASPTASTGPANLTAPDNPLAAAKLTSATAQMYQRIFISYSRADKEVAEAYRLAQLAAGNDVFMDTYSIRSGENWQAALASAIDSADVFQLFWSDNSAKSPNVRDEWLYALKYRCPDTRCAGFIRAVFWRQPLTAPPGELSHLNFRYVPLAAS